MWHHRTTTRRARQGQPLDDQSGTIGGIVTKQSPLYIALGAVVLLAGSTGYFAWRFTETRAELLATTDNLSMQLSGERIENQRSLDEASAEREELQKQIEDLMETVESLRDDRDRLKDDLDEVEDQVGDALKTVGVLDKLAKTDPELLQKYSKVYFLNEHYQPAKLTKLDGAYVYDERKEAYLHAQVVSHFEDMVDDARDEGIDLYVVSAFRSFETQSGLKDAYTVTYGSGANTFSADQGYSEHQLGTAVDFTTKGLNGGLEGFENTPAYEWLLDNAYRYGFTLSYPPGNAYYIFEPWHWRFVGEDLARELHKQGKHFYDLDQRTIDEYLISIFD